MKNRSRPNIAVYLLLQRGHKLAFLLRKNTDWMNGYYSLPSGKVETGESFHMAGAREAAEELGITVDATDLVFKHAIYRRDDQSEWLDVYLEVTGWRGEPINAEPEVHEELAWFAPEKLPDNVVSPVRLVLEQLKSGQSFSEYGW